MHPKTLHKYAPFHVGCSMTMPTQNMTLGCPNVKCALLKLVGSSHKGRAGCPQSDCQLGVVDVKVSAVRLLAPGARAHCKTSTGIVNCVRRLQYHIVKSTCQREVGERDFLLDRMERLFTSEGVKKQELIWTPCPYQSWRGSGVHVFTCNKCS